MASSLSDILSAVQNGVIALNNMAVQIKGSFNNILSRFVTDEANIATNTVAIAFLNSGHYPGTTTNDNAIAGNIGEFISSTVLVGAAVPATSGVAFDVTSILLTAGDWDVWGQVNSNIAVGTVIQITEAYITTTSATRATSPNGGAYVFDQQSKTASTNQAYPVGMTRVSLAIATTVYLGVFSQFITSTNSYYGFIGARRAR